MRWEVVAAVRREKVFLYRVALYEPKKFAFFANQKFSIYRKFYALLSKASRFRNQKTAVLTTFYCPQKPPFHVQKTFFCTSRSLLVSKTAHFHKPKVFLLYKSFLNCYPKQLFSTLRFPFQPPLTYCLQRIQPFFCCSL